MIVKFLKKMIVKKEMERSLDSHFEKWKYADEKMLYVLDGTKIVEEMTFKEYVNRQVANAQCSCRKERKYWENMLSFGQVYPLRSCGCSEDFNKKHSN